MSRKPCPIIENVTSVGVLDQDQRAALHTLLDVPLLLADGDDLVYEIDNNGVVSFFSVNEEGGETLRMQMDQETFNQIRNEPNP